MELVQRARHRRRVQPARLHGSFEPRLHRDARLEKLVERDEDGVVLDGILRAARDDGVVGGRQGRVQVADLVLDQPVGEVDVEQKLEADARVAPARAAEDGEVVQDDVVRLGSVLEELVVRPDEVPAVAVHLTRVHLPRGLPLQQAELVVLDVRKTQGEEDDREEHPDEAQQHARGHVVGPVHDVAVRAPEFVERHAARRRRRRRRGRGWVRGCPGLGTDSNVGALRETGLRPVPNVDREGVVPIAPGLVRVDDRTRGGRGRVRGSGPGNDANVGELRGETGLVRIGRSVGVGVRGRR